MASDDLQSPLLNVAGINYVLSSLPLTDKNLELVFRGDAYYIYHNKNAVPRFFGVKKVHQVSGGQAALEAIQTSSFDPKVEAIVEVPIELLQDPAGEMEFSHRIMSFTPNSVVLEVDSSSKHLLVFNDAYHPGWQAWIDGEETDILRTNYVFKGVVIPPGVHKVIFKFTPPGFRMGLLITIFTVITIFVFVSFYGKKEKERFPRLGKLMKNSNG